MASVRACASTMRRLSGPIAPLVASTARRASKWISVPLPAYAGDAEFRIGEEKADVGSGSRTEFGGSGRGSGEGHSDGQCEASCDLAHAIHV